MEADIRFRDTSLFPVHDPCVSQSEERISKRFRGENGRRQEALGGRIQSSSFRVKLEDELKAIPRDD